MSLVFHYAPQSSAVTVHWALAELGVPCERVRVDLKAGATRTPEFLKLNPNGKVPLLVHDGVPVFESAAIIIHLGEAFGVEKKLFPAPGLQRAEALKWLVWTNVSLGGALRVWFHATAGVAEEARPAAAAGAAAKAEVEQHLGVLDEALRGRTWLVGEAFSLVDVHVLGWTAWVGMCGFDLARFANVDAWVKRGASRPAFREAMS
jgi:glutathione S-transferase